MLAVPNISILSIPVFNFSVITDTISKSVENQLKSSVKTLVQEDKKFSEFAYVKNETLSDADMQTIEKYEDFLLFYLDMLEDIVENDSNRASKFYNYFDDLYTLVLKITTSISYIRSKNKQLLNAA
jgi:hypothetical protein